MKRLFQQARVKTLELLGFRGAHPSSDKVNFDGKSLILFGLNAHGKSAISEAVEFVFQARLGRLCGEGSGGLSQKHIGHISSGGGHVKLVLTDSTEFSQPVENPKKHNIPVEFLMLTRFSMLDFLRSRPQDRYIKTLELMGLENIEEFEFELQKKLREIEGSSEDINSETERKLADIERITGVRPKSPADEDLLVLINNFLAQKGIKKVTSITNFNNLMGEQYRILVLIRAIQEDYKLLKESHKSLQKIFSSIIQKEDLIEKLDSLDILRTGYNYIHKHVDLALCPICEQSIVREKILSTLNKKLQTLNEIKSLKEENEKQLGVFWERLTTTLIHIREITKLIDNKSVSQFLIDLQSKFEKILSSKTANLQNIISQWEELNSSIKTDLESLTSRITILDSSYSKNLGKVELGQELAQLKQLLDDFSIATKRNIKISEYLKNWKSVFESFVSAKKETLKEFYGEMQVVINQIFSRLYTTDYGEHSLEMPDDRRGSLMIVSKFFHIKDDPRAYYSDSQLDALGITIFLARVKQLVQEMPNKTFFVILDDVVTSLDSDYRQKFSQLIVHFIIENPNLQLVLTTHDDMFFEYLKSDSQNIGPNKIICKEIEKWFLNSGISIKDSKEKWERIEIFANILSLSDQDAAVGIAEKCIFEIVITIATKLNPNVEFNAVYRKHIGYHPGVKTVWDAIISKMESSNYYISNKDKFDNFPIARRITARTRHPVVHLPASPSISDIQTALKKIIELRNLFFCIQCSQYVKRQGNMFSCGCSSGDGLNFSI